MKWNYSSVTVIVTHCMLHVGFRAMHESMTSHKIKTWGQGGQAWWGGKTPPRWLRACRWVSGSNGSLFWMGQLTWATWVDPSKKVTHSTHWPMTLTWGMGQCPLTHDPRCYFHVHKVVLILNQTHDLKRVRAYGLRSNSLCKPNEVKQISQKMNL